MLGSRINRPDLLWPLLIAVPLLIALQGFDLDRAVTDFFYDPIGHQFPLKNNQWLTRVFHDGIKWAVVALAVGLLAGWLLSFVSTSWQPARQWLLWVFVAMALSASTVALVKHFSHHACPYDLQIYSGKAPRLGFFEAMPEGMLPGRCWPGGHASTAFSLFGFYFAARHAGRRRLAMGLLGFVIVLGVILSFVQVMRGAHFLSHQVWTAIICWWVSRIVITR
jgi:membrane-associated PAP2 superfamily phosphatase